jgi:hypothetical protein
MRGGLWRGWDGLLLGSLSKSSTTSFRAFTFFDITLEDPLALTLTLTQQGDVAEYTWSRGRYLMGVPPAVCTSMAVSSSRCFRANAMDFLGLGRRGGESKSTSAWPLLLLSLSLFLSLYSLSLSLSDAEQWNGPKLGKGRRIRDLKALKDDVDRFLEGGFSPKYRFPAVGYNGTDETRSKESENIHRWINESCLIISVSVFYS